MFNTSTIFGSLFLFGEIIMSIAQIVGSLELIFSPIVLCYREQNFHDTETITGPGSGLC